MTQHDQISAFIDNELNGEQEQDFLISLASSDALRKSFRSELVLKNVIHRDEVLTTPSRKMRGAVLTTLGMGTAAALTSETADAASTLAPAAKATLLKTMFASKMSAIITASMVTVSALGGYGIHSIIGEKTTQSNVSTPKHITQPVINQTAPQETISPVSVPTDQSHLSAPKRTSAIHYIAPKPTDAAQKDLPGNTLSGTNVAGSKEPVIEKK